MSISVIGRGVCVIAWGLFGALSTAPALAQSAAQGLLDNSFVFNVGGFVVSSQTKANLNGRSVVNPEIDFDRTFGKASDATRARVDALWRINPEHHLRFLYFDNSETRTKTLADDVPWGDYVFLAGSSTTWEKSFKAYELAYEYAFVRAPTYEVAGTLGLHVMDYSFALSGTAKVLDAGGNVISTQASKTTSDLLAPLPVIGIRAGWVVAPQWYIDAQAQIFNISSGNYGGNWSDLRVGATWMINKNFGLGLGYNRFATRVKVDKADFQGTVKLGYSGLQAYLTGTF